MPRPVPMADTGEEVCFYTPGLDKDQCGKASASPCFPACRLDGGRGGNLALLRMFGFDSPQTPIVFREVLGSSGTMIGSDNPLCGLTDLDNSVAIEILYN